jgi:signal transduction histidine kinase
VDGIIVHAIDVTEQVRARQRIEGLLTARDEFLASAAHDLKNPLANMKAQAQLLHRRVSRAGTVQPQQVLRGLENVDGSATRMALLVDDLLDAARLELGQELELQRRPTDLVALATRIVGEHQQATELHQLRLDASVPTLVGSWDAQRLDRVLTNLLENAVKYSPDGGEIVVGLQHDGNVAVLSVHDAGLGVPEADLPYIFERFRRGGNVAGRIGGTGIGLAGVRALVESHGGSIAVNSQEGMGSTFTVRLPLEADGADPHR